MTSPTNCACDGATLPRLVRPWIMTMLAAGDAHGYDIARRLAERRMFAGREPDPPGIYRALGEMEAQGLLSSCWSLGDSGPAKRIFSLTDEGRACLRRWQESLAEYRAGLDELLAWLAQEPAGGPAPEHGAGAEPCAAHR